MRKFFSTWKLFVFFLLLSTCAHAIYLREWSNNRFMVGPNDGLSQILPFKTLLYRHYTEGEFFYSAFFGLGSGVYSELSYYFSTSIVFIMTTAVVFWLESIQLISEPDPLFWARAAIFINIIRLAFVLFIAYHVFRYFDFKPVAALLGASVYGLSGMYFRHAVYWEFFADAYLWLPLLVLGVEKVFRENRSAWFLFAVAVSMIDNFYFAYINFLLTSIYILLRLYLPLSQNETPRWSAIRKFIISGFIGAGISAVAFIPAVYAFMNNHRPAYQHVSPWLSWLDNVLFTSSFIVLPAVFVILLFVFPLYRNRLFQFFSLLVLLGIVLHYSPKIASVFNGFSAPQNRWEYFISFAAGGAVAAGFNSLPKLKITRLIPAGALALLAYAAFSFIDPAIGVPKHLLLLFFSTALIIYILYVVAVQKESKIGEALAIGLLLVGVLASGIQLVLALIVEGATVQTPLFLSIVGTVLFTAILLVRAVRDRSQEAIAAVFIVLTLIFSVNGFQYVLLVTSGNTQLVTEEFITGSDYDDPEINGLLDSIHLEEEDPFYRIEWMESIRNNTPLVQDFPGVSAYSSILNKEILEFYLYDLEIDMGRESVSRYATLGNRTNLHSLLRTNYIISLKGDPNVPAGFVHFVSSANYSVFKNQHPLPFIRGASAVYSEDSLAGESVLRREHAMLSGVVLKNPETASPLPSESSPLPYSIRTEQSDFEDGTLTVTGDSGGLDLLMNNTFSTEEDLYISFHLVKESPDGLYPLTVNGYETSRKSNLSVYKTFVDDLTIRVPAEDLIRIRVPTGRYKLTELEVYRENYQVLAAEAAETDHSSNFRWSGSRLEASYENVENARFLVLPIPYEIGWRAKVNGETVEVLEANYAFIALPADSGNNHIELAYRPPYFYSSLAISIASLILAFVYLQKQRKRTPT
ncbi:putative membrane protein YfhO [Planomicrobium stackebrandtii]|uniref:Membrane protein YfhO n=1 Tax=Planomicrobium stackebrandtii TaxID=253160 RepID=A0ABU0GVX0_9BACL|nr:YfhO family protein [Planomicrobium stackebrandtii]MDQ0428707.1 putative membrane protein YfhO [Planomicrobium stackebrandtii]